MSENPCLAFFETHQANPDKVKDLIETNSGDGWAETYTASLHSPGVVEGHERLVRQVLHPVHWDDESNDVKPTFYADVSNKGLSVNRLCLTTEPDLHAAGRARAAAANGRSLLGFLGFQAHEIVGVMRAIEGGSGAVFDTSLAEDYSHADVCQTMGDRRVGKEIRLALFQAFKGRVRRVID